MNPPSNQVKKFQGLRSLLGYETALLFVALLLGRGLSLLNRGLYWDDWTEIGVPRDAVWNVFWEASLPLKGLVHITFTEPLTSQAVKWMAFFLSAVFFSGCLNELSMFNRLQRLTATLTYALFPVSSVQNIITTTPNYIALFLFFFAFWLLLQDLRGTRRKFYLRLPALVFFLISFQIESLLALYVWPFITIFLLSKKDAKKTLLANLDFFFLPVIYWLEKRFIFTPHGFFTDYNSLKLETALRGLLFHYPLVIWNSLIHPFFYFIKYSWIGPLLLGPFLFPVFRHFPAEETARGFNRKIFKIGLWIFLLGVTPYVLLGGGIDMDRSVGNRYQFLVPVGAAFVMVALVGILARIIRKEWAKHALTAFLIANFLTVNFANGLEYHRDWFMSLSMMEKMKSSPAIRAHHTFFIENHARDTMAVLQRELTFYDYGGMFKIIFGDESRLGLEQYSPGLENRLIPLIPRAEYRIRDYRPHPPECRIIFHATQPLTLPDTFFLLVNSYLKPQVFDERIRNLLQVEVKDYQIPPPAGAIPCV